MKSKLKVPIKPGKTEKQIQVPEFVIEGSDKTACLWLKFLKMPFSRKDTVIIRDINRDVVGKGNFLLFEAVVNGAEYSHNLFPIVVQMYEDEMYTDLYYYSFKLNKVFVFNMSVVVDSGNLYSPIEPLTIHRTEMREHAVN